LPRFSEEKTGGLGGDYRQIRRRRRAEQEEKTGGTGRGRWWNQDETTGRLGGEYEWIRRRRRVDSEEKNGGMEAIRGIHNTYKPIQL
jgi:hypothetical protein